MLSGIRLIASAAARSVRVGGCTRVQRLAQPAAGQRNLVGFIRFLSMSSKDEKRIGKDLEVILTIDEIHDEFEADLEFHTDHSRAVSDPKYKKLQVNTGHEYRYCYLDTRYNSMAYQTPQDPVTYKNLSLIWAMRHVRDHKGGKKAFLFSNRVTDGANPNPPVGDPNTYLTQTNQFTSGGYNLQVLGYGVKFYLEHDPKNKRHIAIFTYLDEEPIDANKYYLQRWPSRDDASIIAIIGSQLQASQLYIFRFESA